MLVIDAAQGGGGERGSESPEMEQNERNKEKAVQGKRRDGGGREKNQLGKEK